ncbi:hypothetical protein [Enterovibrio baiacu]|uniref:hypothetical protein n=1 Tax=Enterovibrio baiacu TaxID=2491023 RepID=UPI003D0A1F21
MKKILISSLVLMSLNAYSAPEDENPINLVKKYSSTIACTVNDNSFQSVEITSNYDEYTIVYWEGDVGCAGGSGSMSGVLTVVGKGRWGELFVLPEIEQPNTKLVCADSITSDNGFLNINGIAYGPDDHQRAPNQKLQYTLKLDVYKNKFDVVKKVDNPETAISNECVSRVR